VRIIYRTIRISKQAVGLILLVGIGLLVWPTGALPASTVADSYPNLYVELPIGGFREETEKTAYLTYDDGPSKNTPLILDVLKEQGVQATFFVMGKEDEASLELYQRIAAEGHTIGIHSYSHQYEEIYRSVEDFLYDFNRIENLIYDTTGIHPRIFRFPGGSANSTAPSRSVMTEIIGEMTARGYLYYDWNAVSGDDTEILYPPEVLADNIVRAARGQQSVVALFHDTPLCTTTPEATKMVIEGLRAQGYRFDRLTEEVRPIQFAKPKKKPSTGLA